MQQNHYVLDYQNLTYVFIYVFLALEQDPLKYHCCKFVQSLLLLPAMTQGKFSLFNVWKMDGLHYAVFPLVKIID